MLDEKELRYQWDKTLYDINQFPCDREGFDEYVFCAVKTPIILSDRELLLRKKIIKDYPTKGSITWYHENVEEDIIPQHPKRVRAEVHVQVIMYSDEVDEDGQNQVRLVSYNQLDIKGKVPTKIVNMTQARIALGMYSSLEDGLKLVYGKR